MKIWLKQSGRKFGGFLVITCVLLPGGLAGANDLVLVVGEPGEERFSAAFSKQEEAWSAAIKTGGGNLLSSIGKGNQKGSVKVESPALPDRTGEGKKEEVVGGGGEEEEEKPKSDLEQFTSLLESLADEESEVPLWIVLMGHGTFDGKTAKFNMRGPDLSSPALANALNPLKRPVVVIHTGSSSAPFLQELSGPKRIVITATKSGFEQSYAYFGEYLAQAIGSNNADIDNDGGTSLLESFLFASKEVAEFFESEGRIATEEALIDDNGDKKGTPAKFFRGIHPVSQPKEGSADGFRAHQLHLVPPKDEKHMTPEMRAKRDRIELQVHELRQKKSTMEAEAYYAALKPLLLDLARLYEQLEKKNAEEGKAGAER